MPITDNISEEHEWIEQSMKEIETIMCFKTINYSNLIHVLKEFAYFWEDHILKEKHLFLMLEEQSIKTPLKNLLEEDELIKNLRSFILSEISTGSEWRTRKALEDQGKKFILAVRRHIRNQEWVFYALPELKIEDALQKSNKSEGLLFSKWSLEVASFSNLRSNKP